MRSFKFHVSSFYSSGRRSARTPKLALSIALLVACTAVSIATTIIPMSVEDLTRSASDIVEARAVASRSAWNEQHTLIYTYTTFQVTRALKGAPAATITLKQLGGSAEGYTQKISGVRHAQAGEDALLFLRASAANDGTYVVVGLMQGDFRVFRNQDGNTMVTNGISAAQAVEGGSARPTEFIGSPMTLAQAEARIRRAQQ